MSYFEFNGKKSSDFGLKLEGNMDFSSPARNMDFEKILGQDGELALGDGTLNNTKVSFPFTIKAPPRKTIEQVACEISNWLKKDSSWHDLYFAGDPNYVYQAIFLDEYDVQRTLSTFGKCVLSFTIKPYKFLKSGLKEITSPKTLTNPTLRYARPRIHMKGSGDIKLVIGGSTLYLENVDDEIIIDSLYNTVFNPKTKTPVWSKVISPVLPTIRPGEMNISYTGKVTDLKIIPRYEVIV